MPILLTRRRAMAAMASTAAAYSAPSKKPVALVITEYRQNSHADVIGTRLLEGYEYDGKLREPRVHPVSIFVDQHPENDMSRAMASKHKVMLYDTVYDALTLGAGKLAVAGVVLIGEHGNYPYNEKSQHLYPRYELFSQVVDVFKQSGRSVPVFCDKHLSVDWAKARQMYDWSRELNFPLMAGSSLPVCWRKPALEIPFGAKVKFAVTAHYGPTESYGFHSLEMLQAMVERRAGGETGVASTQLLEGRTVWEWTDANPWAAKLLEAAMARSLRRESGDPRTNAKQPAVILADYHDGLRTASYLLNGHLSDATFAAEIDGRPEPVSTCFWLQPVRFYGHFSNLCHFIEETILNARAPYPVERTLLTTGVLAAEMESGWRGGKRVETPHLQLRYVAPKRDLYARGPEPAPELEQVK